MDVFLTPKLSAQFVYMMGLAIAIVYLVMLPKKSRDTKLVVTVLVAWLIMTVTVNLYELSNTHQLESGAGFKQAPYMTWLVFFCQSAIQAFLAVLIYRVGFAFSPREERVLLVALVLFAGWIYWSYFFFLDESGKLVERGVAASEVHVYLNAWLILVGARKLYRAKQDGQGFRSRQLVLIVTLAAVAILVYNLANSPLSYWPFSAELRGLAPVPMAVFVASLLIIGYLLYGEEKHSLLVKLVGFLLLVYLALYSIVLPILRPEIELRRDFQDPGQLSSLAFTPDSLGGYTMQFSEPEWIEPEGESYLIGDDNAVLIRSDFEFPFYGIDHDSVWVGTNGSLSFAVELDADFTFSEGDSFFDDIASVMPMYADYLMASAGAESIVETSQDRLVVTWNGVSNFDIHESTVTMQAVLYPDGRIEFNYGDLTTIPLLHIIGISPGGRFDQVDFSDSALSSGSNAALFDFEDNRIAYRSYVHPLVVPVTQVGIVGLFLVLILGIVFYRAGVLRPLERVLAGLGSVEAGDLDAEVVIGEKNELGSLALYFNRMTASLREYSTRMEELVAKRTEDLADTIVDLKATQAQLVEQEKLASLGSLTAGIAHEIKNPLNFVNNFAEVSEELAQEILEALDAGNGEEARRLAKEIATNSDQITKHGQRADSIVKAMMQHAKGGKSEREDVDVNAFVEEYANLSWHGMRARNHGFQGEIETSYDAMVGTISAQPQELGRVLVNLLNNAFDAIKNKEDGLINISTNKVKNGIQIRVSDNGPGIPDAIRVKIFEPFFTTKETGEGTGLGLSLSHDIVAKGHGGTMSVAESKTGGAEFTIVLPS